MTSVDPLVDMQATVKPNLVQRTTKFVPLAAACVGFTAYGLYQVQAEKDIAGTQPKCISDPETREMAVSERERA